MRVLKCVFLLAAFAAAVSADTTIEDKTTSNTTKVIDATTSSSSSSGNESLETTQDNDAFKIEPQPKRVPATTAPSTTSTSPSTDSSAGSVEAPSSTPDETIASSSTVAVAPTAFALVSAVVFAMF